jgi:hypothetical protein
VKHELEIRLERRHAATAQFFLDEQSHVVLVVRLDFDTPVDVAEVANTYGEYSAVPCEIELLPGELEGVLVRSGPGSDDVDVEMLVFSGPRVVAEKYDDSIATLRFLGDRRWPQGDSCP